MVVPDMRPWPPWSWASLGFCSSLDDLALSETLHGHDLVKCLCEDLKLLRGVGENLVELCWPERLDGAKALKVPQLDRNQDASSSWSVGCFPEGRADSSRASVPLGTFLGETRGHPQLVSCRHSRSCA